MTIAIHQPNYFPWPGYFYKIYASDIFVFHDVVPFSKASYTKRCRIRKDKHSAENIWLSVPLRRHASGTRISNVQIAKTRSWPLDHLHKMENTYRSAPYFGEYASWLKDMLMKAGEMDSLGDCNMFLVREIAGILDLRPEFRRSSEMDCRTTGSALNLEIVETCGGSVYLSGRGSTGYEDESAFAHHGISLIRHDLYRWMEEHPYDQGTPGFANGLSVVDALMHLGAGGLKDCFAQYHTHRSAHAG